MAATDARVVNPSQRPWRADRPSGHPVCALPVPQRHHTIDHNDVDAGGILEGLLERGAIGDRRRVEHDDIGGQADRKPPAIRQPDT